MIQNGSSRPTPTVRYWKQRAQTSPTMAVDQWSQQGDLCSLLQRGQKGRGRTERGQPLQPAPMPLSQCRRSALAADAACQPDRRRGAVRREEIWGACGETASPLIPPCPLLTFHGLRLPARRAPVRLWGAVDCMAHARLWPLLAVALIGLVFFLR